MKPTPALLCLGTFIPHKHPPFSKGENKTILLYWIWSKFKEYMKHLENMFNIEG